MIAKPNRYDEVEIVEFDYEPIILGGHKGIIKNVEEYISEQSGKKSLKVYVDMAGDDIQQSYFTYQYKNDTRPDKKWSNQAIKYVSLGEEENQIRMLKGFLTAYENSNNCKFDWNGEWNQLKNKRIGLVFGLEEYYNQNNELKTIVRLRDFRSIDKVENVKIPKVKLAEGTYVDYEEYVNVQKNQSERTKTTLNDENYELPF